MGSLIPVAPAGAQTAAACVTAACTSAQQSQLSSLLSPFTTLVGTNALSPTTPRRSMPTARSKAAIASISAPRPTPTSRRSPDSRVTPGRGTASPRPGAQSLNLTVAGQTTNSLRSVLGAQLGGVIDLGWREKLALQFRLGWSHEYADTARPVTATLAGAPLMPFTTYGIAPTRDGAVVGFSANTAIADGASAYLRYDGNVSGPDSAHALTAGVRMSW